MQIPPDVQDELKQLNDLLVDIHAKHQMLARMEAEPILERIQLIHDCYPAPLVVDLRQHRMPFLEETN